MSDWPELDEAADRRNRELEESRRSMRARQFVEEVEQEVAQKAWLEDQRARCLDFVPAVRLLADQWVTPVNDLLRQLSIKTWHIPEGSSKGFKLETRLVFPFAGSPPEICWEASRQTMWYSGWYIVHLIVDKKGTAQRFEVTAANEWVLKSQVDLEYLKGVLVEAYLAGPLRDLHRRPEPGFPIERAFQSLA